MTDNPDLIDWKQDFPTYNFSDPEILLHEYDAAAKLLESEERVFINASNIIIALTSLLGSLTIASIESLIDEFTPVFSPFSILIFIIVCLAVLSITSLLYLADRQKSVVLSSRKVIVLRRMLGLNYGPVDLVLPSKMVEGADDPFEIRFFSGWGYPVAYPFWWVNIFSVILMVLLWARLINEIGPVNPLTILPPWVPVTAIAIIWFTILAIRYRSALFEKHDNWLLLFIKVFSKFLRVRLIPNIEYVIYRAILARHETRRLNVDLSNLKKMAVAIEDDRFYEHRGISIRGIGRALLGVLKIRERSGGSTITMQLSRTLFIEEHHKLIRRKLLEFLLALWLESKFKKNDIIELYLVSVRFDAGIYGVLAGMQHFFGRILETPSIPEAFFLIERLSVVRSVLLNSKVAITLRRSVQSGEVSPQQADRIVNLYHSMVNSEKVVEATARDIERLIADFSAR